MVYDINGTCDYVIVTLQVFVLLAYGAVDGASYVGIGY